MKYAIEIDTEEGSVALVNADGSRMNLRTINFKLTQTREPVVDYDAMEKSPHGFMLYKPGQIVELDLNLRGLVQGQ